MAEISASIFYEVEQAVKEMIDQSELARMARKHFDEESAKEMIKELKDSVVSELDYVLMGGDEDYEDEEDVNGDE